MADISAARSDLAPHGKLRVGINFQNDLLTVKATGLVARVIAKNGVRGVTVAAAASAR